MLSMYTDDEVMAALELGTDDMPSAPVVQIGSGPSDADALIDEMAENMPDVEPAPEPVPEKKYVPAMLADITPVNDHPLVSGYERYYFDRVFWEPNMNGIRTRGVAQKEHQYVGSKYDDDDDDDVDDDDDDDAEEDPWRRRHLRPAWFGGIILRNEKDETRGMVNSVEDLEFVRRNAMRAGLSIHEIMLGDYCMRHAVDVDAKQECIDASGYKRDEVAAWILHAVAKASFRDDLSQYSIATSSDSKKLSLHFVRLHELSIDLAPDHHELAGFVAAVQEELPAPLQPFIDVGWPKVEFGLRLLGCAKGGRRKVPTRHSASLGHNKLEDYLVQSFSYCKEKAGPCNWRKHSVTPEERTRCASNPIENGAAKRVVEAAVRMDGALEYLSNKAGFIKFCRSRPGPCAQCKRVHENAGGFVCQHSNQRFYFHCWRATKGTPGVELEVDFSEVVVPVLEVSESKTQPKPTFAERIRRLVEGAECRIPKLTADETYSEPKMRPYPAGKKFILVAAPCKTGKSVQVIEYLEKQVAETPNAAIVYVTCKISQGADFGGRSRKLGFESYQKIKGTIDLNAHPRAIVQLESLHRIDWANAEVAGRKIILVLDEAVGIIAQQDAGLCRYQSQTVRVMQELMANAHRVIGLDAYLDDGLVDVFARYLGERPYVIDNQSQVHAGSVFHINASLPFWRKHLLDWVRSDVWRKAGKGCAMVACGSKKIADGLARRIGKILGPERVANYTADTDPNIKKEHFGDVHKYWANYDVVIYSPTLEVGVSYEHDRFQRVYAQFDNSSVTAESGLQMLFRNRPATEYHINLGSKLVGAGATTPEGVRVDIERGQGYRAKELPVDIQGAGVYTKDGRICGLPDFPRFHAFLYNEARQNRSKRNFHEIFIGRLRAWGARLVFVEDTTTKAERKAIRSECAGDMCEVREENAAAIAAARELNDEELEQIRDNPVQSLAEKHCLTAAYLRRLYGKDGQPLTKEFVLKWGGRKTTAAFRNIRELREAGSPETALAGLKEAALSMRKMRIEVAGSERFGEVCMQRAVMDELTKRCPYTVHKFVHDVAACVGLKGLEDFRERPSTEIKLDLPKLCELRSRVPRGVDVCVNTRGALKDFKSALPFVNATLALYGMALKMTRRVGREKIGQYALVYTGAFALNEEGDPELPAWRCETLEGEADVQKNVPAST